MNCPECGLPLFRYDDTRVTCKQGHRWTPTELADTTTIPPVLRRARGGRRITRRTWLPGAVLGGAALLLELVRVVIG